MVLLNGVGAAAGPGVVSTVVAAGGPAAYFFFLAGVLVVTGAYALWRLTRRPAPPLEDRAVFLAVLSPSITPVIADLAEIGVAGEAEDDPLSSRGRGSPRVRGPIRRPGGTTRPRRPSR